MRCPAGGGECDCSEVGVCEVEPRHSFHPYEADGSPRVFVGMFRPPFDEWSAQNYPGMLWYHQPQLRERWLRGEGDRPLYAPSADLPNGESASVPHNREGSHEG